MANDQIKAELEALRAQLEALKRAEKEREQEKSSPAGSAGGDNPPADGEGVVSGNPETEPESSELLAQFRELLDSLDEELKESNPTTLLAVFTLGIVVGRLLPR